MVLIAKLLAKRLVGDRHTSKFLSFALKDAISRGDGCLHLCSLCSAAVVDQTQWSTSLASDKTLSPAKVAAVTSANRLTFACGIF